jgi:hypothetical protein
MAATPEAVVVNTLQVVEERARLRPKLSTFDARVKFFIIKDIFSSKDLSV